MSLFVLCSGHVKVVKYLVKKVTQFPSDQECYNYIQSIKDKDPELRMRCAQCVETIITAKERQEKEANKHADALLREIENDKQRRNRKKEKKEEKKQKKEKKLKNPVETETNQVSEATAKKPDVATSPATTPTPPKEGKKAKAKKLRAEGSNNKSDDTTGNSAIPTNGSVTPEKTKSIESGTPPATRVPTTGSIAAGSPESEDPADKALKSMMTKCDNPIDATQPKATLESRKSLAGTKRDEKREAANKRRSKGGEAQGAAQNKTLEFVNTELKELNLKEKANVAHLAETTKQTQPHQAAAQQPAQQEEKLGWDVVKTKKPIRKLVLPSGQIARVIGRSGCNVNAIRDVTGTHIATVVYYYTITYIEYII